MCTTLQEFLETVGVNLRSKGEASTANGEAHPADGETSITDEEASATDGETSPTKGETSAAAGNASKTHGTPSNPSRRASTTSRRTSTSEENSQQLEGKCRDDPVDIRGAKGEDTIIAVMGPTGSGKSSFIAKVTKQEGKVVGYDSTSCTSDIKATKCDVEGFSVVLVDTPGFDDTNKSDMDILRLISDWLNTEYRTSQPILSAILYFHRITDNRMAGTPLKNLRVFEKLCGENAMSKVILVTTMWDEVEIDVGTERLKELKDSYWKGMISRGSTTFECEDARGSPMKLLRQIVQQKKKRELTGGEEGNVLSLVSVWSFMKLPRLPQWLKKEEESSVLLQREISTMKLEIKETAAGQQLCSRLEKLAQKRLETLGKIQEETKRADEKTAKDLWKEFNEIKDQLDSTLSQARELKMNPATRWLRRSVGRFRAEFRRDKRTDHYLRSPGIPAEGRDQSGDETNA